MEKISEIDRIVVNNILSKIGDSYGAQKKLADDAKISPITLNKVLRLKQRAGRELIASIAAATNQSEEWFYQAKTDTQKSSDEYKNALAQAISVVLSVEWTDSNLAYLEALAEQLNAQVEKPQDTFRAKR